MVTNTFHELNSFKSPNRPLEVGTTVVISTDKQVKAERD